MAGKEKWVGNGISGDALGIFPSFCGLYYRNGGGDSRALLESDIMASDCSQIWHLLEWDWQCCHWLILY